MSTGDFDTPEQASSHSAWGGHQAHGHAALPAEHGTAFKPGSLGAVSNLAPRAGTTFALGDAADSIDRERGTSSTASALLNPMSQWADNAHAGMSAEATAALPTAPAALHRDADEHHGPLAAPTLGMGAALGREGFVNQQAARAYSVGMNAPQIDFDGTVHRTVDTNRNGRTAWDGYANHLYSDKNGGRYNDPGQRLIYISPSASESVGEMGAYAKPDQPAMAGKTRVELQYHAETNPATGRGGVADVSGNLSNLGLTRSALTEPKGSKGIHRTLLSKLTGEDPYLYSRAVGRGAEDAGASALRVPSATGGNQLDILPRNTEPHQLQYQQHVNYDAAGLPGPSIVDPAHASQHAPSASGAHGPGVMPPGNAPSPHGQNPATAEGATHRAGAARYAALGSGLTSAWHDINAVRDGKMSAGQAVADTALNTGVGGASGLATDALTHRLGGGLRGGLKGGAVVDALTSGAFSTWDNAKAFREGRETAGQATANVAVDTGVGIGAGLAGAAAGAAAGSIVPIAGTAVGALVGFGAGMLGGWAAHKLADSSGFTDWSKQRLGGALNHFNKPLTRAWDGVSSATNAIGNTASNVAHGAGNLVSGAGHAISNGFGRLWHGRD